MGEIAQEMVARAKAKLASGKLSETDKSYYEHVVRDMNESPAGAGRLQEATQPPASSAPAAAGKPAAYATFFGGGREQEQRQTYFGTGKPSASPAAPASRTFFGRSK